MFATYPKSPQPKLSLKASKPVVKRPVVEIRPFKRPPHVYTGTYVGLGIWRLCRWGISQVTCRFNGFRVEGVLKQEVS